MKMTFFYSTSFISGVVNVRPQIQPQEGQDVAGGRWIDNIEGFHFSIHTGHCVLLINGRKVLNAIKNDLSPFWVITRFLQVHEDLAIFQRRFNNTLDSFLLSTLQFLVTSELKIVSVLGVFCHTFKQHGLTIAVKWPTNRV